MTTSASPAQSGTAITEDETIRFVQELIRIPSVNTGDLETIGDGEARAARYVLERLQEAGLSAEYVEPVPGRGNVVCRIPGADPSRGGLLLHAHLDVVPVVESEWTHPPFDGVLADGVVHGRGALDMKNSAGMLLAVARAMARESVVPARDVIFAWFSDEENGSVHGSAWITEHRPDLFAGVTQAVTEGGGYSLTLPNGKRAYLLSTAEKGGFRLRLTARGQAGHGAIVHDDNPVTRLAEAVSRLGRHQFPVIRTPHLDALVAGLEEAMGTSMGDDLDASLGALGPAGNTLRASMRNTANPTMLTAGYKRNVVPSTAEAQVDCRVLPGSEEHFAAEVEAIVGPGIELEWKFGWTIESPADDALVSQIKDAIAAEDPGASVIPHLLPGGTDNKLLAKIGIQGYGFVPMQVPADFDFWRYFHAVDEQAPVEAIRFGARVLDHLVRHL